YWLEKSAKQGNVDAQYNLGIAYLNGKGIAKDYEKAADWWRKAAEQGNANAQNNLGVAYEKGQGITQDYEIAVNWWGKAAKQGHISAQFNLAKIYDKQKNEAVQNKTSFEWLCQVAASLVSLNEKIDDDTTIFEPIFDKDDVDYLNQQDNAVTQVILALLYKTGNAVQKDEQQAFSLFQKAAQQQDILAQYCLGLAYMEGKGIAVNIEKAREQFQKNIDRLKEKQVFSYIPFSLGRNDTEDSQDYPLDVRQWIALLARDKLSLLDERAARQQLAAAKQDLEDIMAMFAHKFRGPLQKIEYHVEKGHPAKRSLDAIHTMRGLLDIFSVISTNPTQLRDLLKQDRQGKGTLLSVLEKSLILAIYQLLSINQVDKIRQHYFAYAKRMGQIPSTITRLVWEDEYFELEEQLQSEWEDKFTTLLNDSHLDDIVAWMDKRFFPIHIQGFTDNPIRFACHGTTVSVLTIVMTEMILNAIKYYASENRIPLQLQWYCEKDVCHFVSQNPTAIEEQSGKGSGRGHKFLGLIAKQLGGDFPKPRFQDDYVAEFCMPTHLLIEEK
ncbi:MAG: tetratricopeptide repeat protein, partial [Candidatus Parabeggiatoa sp.]|nr:tetratricopeptide repeat protein [Candidatus Parabeggiatoa sp.]